MQEAKQEEKRLASLLRWVFVVMAIAMVLALAGVILGAINFTSPVTYPSGVLAAWFVVDLLLVVLVVLHIVLFGFMAGASGGGDIDESLGAILGFSILVLIGAWILLANRHFAWVSLIAFIVLIGFTIGDIAFLAAMRD